MTDLDPGVLRRQDAECALYWDAPRWRDRPTVAVGRFACNSVDGGADLLSDVASLARRRGYGAVIGPMDGDTWHRYRLVTRSDGTPPFLLEPVSSPHDHAAFIRAGFAPIAEYASARAPLAATMGAPAAEIPGIRIEPWDGRNAEALIGQLFALSSRAFAGNAFFKPITREAFLALYEPVIPAIDPELVLFARSGNDDLAGFLFALPNAPVGQTDGSVIIKTYASAVRGCGRWLLDRFHRRALDLGFAQVIHALMHADNVSRDRSARSSARIFREYALMGLDLDATDGP